MSKRGSYFPDKETGKDWSNWGVVCLYCGERFYGGINKGAMECANHTTVEHPGEALSYAAFATPQSYEAEKKAKFMTSTKEALNLDRILRDHGSGWYFYALHYGVSEADDHIKQLRETEGDRPKGLREMVQERERI